MLRTDLLEHSIDHFIVRVNVLLPVGGSGLARIVLQVMIECWVTWELGVRLSVCEALVCLIVTRGFFLIPGEERRGKEERKKGEGMDGPG